MENIIKKFREKWGRFYYSDKIGMDWEKPSKQAGNKWTPDRAIFFLAINILGLYLLASQ